MGEGILRAKTKKKEKLERGSFSKKGRKVEGARTKKDSLLSLGRQ